MQYLDKSEPLLQRKKTRRPYSTPNPGYHGTTTLSPGAVDPDALINHTLKLNDWLNEKSIKSIQVSTPCSKIIILTVQVLNCHENRFSCFSGKNNIQILVISERRTVHVVCCKGPVCLHDLFSGHILMLLIQKRFNIVN